MRLLRVELTRFRSRRAIVLVLLAATALTAVLAASAAWDTRPVSPAEQARAEQQVARDAQSPGFRREYRRCLENPEDYVGSDDAADCDQMMPQVEWYLYRSTLSLKQEKDDRGLALLLILAALSIVVGTTFAGADWASGSLSNQLLFEPRRIRVWAAKAVAVALGAVVASAVLVTAFWAVLYLVAESRGISTGATVQEQIRAVAARGVVLAGVGALGGCAATMLFRNTVATLAVLFAYAAGGEALTATLPIDRVSQWGLSNNVFAWLRNGTPVYDESIRCRPNQGMCDQTYTLALEHGAGYLGGLLLAVVVVSLLLFRRRDVA